MRNQRTPPVKKARELAKYLRSEHPDYTYLKKLFYHLRDELAVEVSIKPKKLPIVPSDEEIKRLYNAIWQSRCFQDIIIIKTFLYTGIRVGELVNIHLDNVDFSMCQIRINKGKGSKDRIVVFPPSFKEVLAMHHQTMHKKQAVYLFESSWNRKYSERGIRKMLQRYGATAGLKYTISPHKLRHFFLLWLKKQGIDDAFIQPYSGHASRQSLEVYSQLAMKEAQEQYNKVIGSFPV